MSKLTDPSTLAAIAGLTTGQNPALSATTTKIGAFVNLPGSVSVLDAVKTREAFLGSQIRVMNTFSTAAALTDAAPTQDLVQAGREGRYTVISLGAPDLNTVLTGAMDGTLRSLAVAFRGHPFRIGLRLMWEMNIANGIGPWAQGTVNLTPAVYRAAFRYIVQFLRAAGVTNVDSIFCPNIAQDPVGANGWRAYYPGNDVTEFVACDGYQNIGAGTVTNPWLWAESLFDPILTDFITGMNGLAVGKPFAVGEWGCDTSVSGSRPFWFIDTAAYFRNAGVKFANLFDTVSVAAGGTDYRLDQDTSLEAFRTINGHGLFEGNIKGRAWRPGGFSIQPSLNVQCSPGGVLTDSAGPPPAVFAGKITVNAGSVYTITLANAAGTATTTPVTDLSTFPQIKAAIEALPNVDAGGAVIHGAGPTAFQVSLVGAAAPATITVTPTVGGASITGGGTLSRNVRLAVPMRGGKTGLIVKNARDHFSNLARSAVVCGILGDGANVGVNGATLHFRVFDCDGVLPQVTTTGAWTLSYGGQTTASIPAGTDPTSAIAALSTVQSVTVQGGSSTWLPRLAPNGTPSGAAMTVTGATLTAVNTQLLGLTGTGSAQTIAVAGNFNGTWGDHAFTWGDATGNRIRRTIIRGLLNDGREHDVVWRINPTGSDRIWVDGNPVTPAYMLETGSGAGTWNGWGAADRFTLGVRNFQGDVNASTGSGATCALGDVQYYPGRLTDQEITAALTASYVVSSRSEGGITRSVGVGAPTHAGQVGDRHTRQDGTPGQANNEYQCTTAGGPGAAVWTALY